MKRMINAFKIGFYVFKNPDSLDIACIKLNEQMAMFLKSTIDNNSPMITHLGHVDVSYKGYNTLLSVWAGFGDNNPIQRCKELNSKVNAQKQQIHDLYLFLSERNHFSTGKDFNEAIIEARKIFDKKDFE